MNFWISLVSADGKISSKRFAGLGLISMFIVITVLGAIGGNIPMEVESLVKVGLYTGATLLGSSVVPDMIKVAQRPIIQKIEKEDESD